MHVRRFLPLVLLVSLASAQVSLQHTAYPFSGYGLITGDFNGDGAPDLLGHSGDSQDSFLLRLNDGHGGFSASLTTIPTGGYVHSMVALDARKAGRSDVAACYSAPTLTSQPSIGLWLATNGPSFASPISFPLPGLCLDVLAADFNGDGNIDLAGIFYASNGDGTYTSGLHVLFGDGTGRFSAGPTSVITDPCSFGTAGAVSGDFNHDGRIDALISFGCGNTGVVFAYGHGDGTFSLTVSSTNEDILNLRKDDVDQDGWLDWTTRGDEQSGASNLSYFLNQRNGGIPSWNTQMPYDVPCQSCTGGAPNFVLDGLATDVNGDGLKDAVVTERHSAPNDYNDAYFLSAIANNGDGTYGAPARFSVGAEPLQVTAADFDRDGRIDFAVTTINGDGGDTTEIFLNRTSTAPLCAADPIVRSVKVCSSAQIAGNRLHLLANSTDAAPITGMKVYIDNTMIFYSPNDLINRWLTLPNGGHRVTVRAWDERGSFSSARWINVNTSFGCPALTTDRSVNLCFPIGTATVGSPTQIVAEVRTSKSYRGAKVYIDRVAKYSASSKQVNTNLNLSLGTHRITVQAFDSQGSFSKTVYATVR